MKDKRNTADHVTKLTDTLEAGVANIFESGKYRDYLRMIAKFHKYSANNCFLILDQCPFATFVAGYSTWKKLGRQVKRGEKSIRILSPIVRKRDDESEDDPEPIGYRSVSVFDVSQTEGKELPMLSKPLVNDVENYGDLSAALQSISPVPVSFADIPGTAKGYYSRKEQCVVVREGMGQAQTVKTLVHEIAHAVMHADGTDLNANAREVQAESVAFVVSAHLGLDTSDYSFGYIASWSSGKELKELKSALDTIRATAHMLIESISKVYVF